jgi:hypothetical protein
MQPIHYLQPKRERYHFRAGGSATTIPARDFWGFHFLSGPQAILAE